MVPIMRTSLIMYDINVIKILNWKHNDLYVFQVAKNLRAKASLDVRHYKHLVMKRFLVQNFIC